MDVDDGLGLHQALAQALALALQDGNALGLRVRDRRLGTAFSRGQSRQDARLALLAPGGQVRRIQPLTAQQGAQLARCTGIGLGQDPLLVGGREAAATSVALRAPCVALRAPCVAAASAGATGLLVGSVISGLLYALYTKLRGGSCLS